MAIKINGVTVIDDDKVFNVGSGTTAERPDPASDGMWRYNTELEIYEIYVDSSWTSFASAVTTSQPSGMLQLFPTGTASSTWVNIRSGQNPVLSQTSYPNLYSIFGLRSNVITWTARTVGTLTSTSPFWNNTAVVYGNGVYVVAGTGGIYPSTNAINWTARTSGTSSTFNTVVYGNGLYVAGGINALLRTSPDSINWTTRSYGVGTTILASTYGNGLYVLGGASGTIRSSTDAANWTAGTSGTTSAINALTYGNGVYVAACGVSEIRTSTNAINWTVRTSNTTSQIGYLLYGGGQFLYGGSAGLLGTSTNAINWTTRSFGTSVSNGLAYGAGYYATGGWVSKDAITWVPRSNSNGTYILSMCYGDNGFVHTFSGGGGAGVRSWYPYTYDITTEFVPPSVVPFGIGTSLNTTLNYNAPDYPSQYIKR